MSRQKRLEAKLIIDPALDFYTPINLNGKHRQEIWFAGEPIEITVVHGVLTIGLWDWYMKQLNKF